MNIRRKFAPALAALSLAAAGCQTVPVWNPRVDFPPRDPAAVEQAILQGMANRQWVARKEAPGVIVGTLNLRNHQAVIRVEYTGASYAIRYAESRDLLYEVKPGGAEVIHRNYNSWIKNLVRDVNALLGIPFVK